MQINGSTALVTGANRGIGRALVEALVARGAATVYAGMRRPGSLDGLAADPRLVPVQVDITDPAQVAAAAQRAGEVTLLVNNAGSIGFADPLTGDVAAIESDLRTNFFGTLDVTRAFVPVLERNGGGAIVNLLSLVVFAGPPAMGGYTASKAAAAAATQALRAQLAGKMITVHAVYPGAVDTDMIRDFPIPKTSPTEVAGAILDGIQAGQESIFPDAMAREGYKLWREDPSALERQMASI